MKVTLEQIILAQEDIKVMQEETKLRQDALEAMIKVYEEQQEETEFPKEGDTYYLIYPNGSIIAETYESAYDRIAYLIGNYFRTKEEAEFAREQLKVIAEMKRCGGKIRAKRTDVKEYYIRFESYFQNSETAVVIKSYAHIDARPDMWFPTEEAAQKALDTIGEERMMKYWFCVEV